MSTGSPASHSLRSRIHALTPTRFAAGFTFFSALAGSLFAGYGTQQNLTVACHRHPMEKLSLTYLSAVKSQNIPLACVACHRHPMEQLSLTYLSAVKSQNIPLACEAAPRPAVTARGCVSPIDPLLTIHKSCILSVFLDVSSRCT